MNWKKEPLVHFLLLGALLFGLSAVLGDRTAGAELDTITVTEDDIRWLASAWARQWRRPPTREELDGLIRNHIREEILYREALEMGLDRDDTIIRRRLVQKIEFLTEDLIDQIDPSEDELRAHFEENVESYRVPERRTFTHVYFSFDRRGEAAVADAEAALTEIRSRRPQPERAPDMGDRFMMQYDYPRRSQAEVAQHMGREFAEALFELEPGEWHGPVRSGYGIHLVRISALESSVVPEFSQVVDRVRDDLQRGRRERANEAFYEGLKQRYEIVVEDLAAAPETAGG
jgi:hypothetical protein